MSKQQNNKKSGPHSPGVARDSLFFFFIYLFYLNSIHLFILFKFNSFNSIQSSSKLAFLKDARELVAREVRQTCAARSGRARSHGLVNKAATVVRQLPYDAVAYVNATKDEPKLEMKPSSPEKK
jgi:hypothetical protein